MTERARRVLIVHPDEAQRRELRTALEGAVVLEAASRLQAVPLLKDGPSLVVSHAAEFKRLLRDLERFAPAAIRAVLCPVGDEATRRSLVEVAADGYDFFTLDEGSMDGLRRLLLQRSAVRVPLPPGLEANFFLKRDAFTAAVVDVSNDGLTLLVASGAPLERFLPGTSLDGAEVRAAQGTVLEPGRWVVRTVRQAADSGRPLLGVAFVKEPRASAPPATVDDAVRVRGLLHRGRQRGVRFEVALLGGRGRPRASSLVELDVDGETARLEVNDALPARAGDVVRLGFDLGGLRYEGLCAVRARSEGRLVLSLPTALERHHRRASLRARLGVDAEAFITFASPLAGASRARPVLDLTAGGVSFPIAAEREAFPPGLVLGDVALVVGGRTMRCRAVVQGTGPLGADDPPLGPATLRCGARLEGLAARDRAHLLDVLFQGIEPRVTSAQGVPFAEIWRLFVDEGVRFPDYPQDTPPPELVAAQAALARQGHGVGHTLLFRGAQGAVVGHASGLRIYSRTWLSAHLLVRSGFHRSAQASQTLVNMSFDFGEAQEDVEYLKGLWGLSNRWAARIYGAATPRLVRPGLSCLSTFRLLRHHQLEHLPPAPQAARPAGEEELLLLLQHLRRIESPVRLRADDLDEQEAHLATASRRYAATGLQRGRVFGTVDGPDGPRGWVLCESMSPGVFWMELCDSFRLVLAEPNAPDADGVRHALVDFAVWDARRRGRAVARCLASEDDVPALTALGFEAPLGVSMEFCAHRSMARDMAAQLFSIFERVRRAEARGEDK